MVSMSTITRIGTYLPTWGSAKGRQVGDDEDAVTLAVAAGVAALGDDATLRARVAGVVLVTRDLPLLEGGNSAALLGGLGLPDTLVVRETVGGSPAVLDEILAAADGTLVIGADTGSRDGAGAGASAILCGNDNGGTGAPVTSLGRVTRSMPTTVRDADGHRIDYADPRLLRERGVNESLDRLGNIKAVAVAGITGKEAAGLCSSTPPALPTVGASAAGFALAALVEAGVTGPVLAAEQATLSLAELGAGDVAVCRDEQPTQPRPEGKLAPGASVSISLSAYERAFDAKLRLDAARCTSCGTLSYPHRYRCIECGSEEPTETIALPRTAEIYTQATIRVPVPGLISPYTVTLVELGDTGVRVLVKLTGAPPGSTTIGDRGRMVFRLVAVRQGVPDYGYAFLPEGSTNDTKEAAA
jgi:uncharacterized OB-fold protein